VFMFLTVRFRAFGPSTPVWVRVGVEELARTGPARLGIALMPLERVRTYQLWTVIGRALFTGRVTSSTYGVDPAICCSA
jgi:hypothetical protein